MNKRTPKNRKTPPAPQPQPAPVQPGAPRRIEHGYYHVSWAKGHPDPQARQLADLLFAAGQGMSVMHLSHLQSADHTTRLLDTAGEHGMRLWLEDVHPSERDLFAAHPALAGYSVADDANTLTPERLRTLTAPEASRGAARYISIGASVARDNAWCYGLTETIGVQLYAFPTENLLAYWPILLRARALATQHGQRLYANLQIHANGSRQWPTPGQVRAQALMAAAAGVDGILHYALLDTPEGFQRPPNSVLAAVEAAAAEVRGPLPARVVGNLLHAGPHVVDLGTSEVVG